VTTNIASGVTVPLLFDFYCAQGTYTGAATLHAVFGGSSSNTGEATNVGLYDNRTPGSTIYGIYHPSGVQSVMGKTSFGVGSAPGALVDIGVGTTATAQLRLRATGLATTTALSGNIRYDGTNIHLTDGSLVDRLLAYNPLTTTGDIIYSSSTTTAN